MRVRFEASEPLRGRVAPPPDKSISHRAALLGAMCDEPVTIENYLYAEDTLSTLDALRSLGAAVEPQEEGALLVRGVGLRTAAPTTGGMLNVRNSGTLLRMLPGWLAGQPGGIWTLDGDDSIRRRPVSSKILQFVQTGCAVVIIFYMLYVTFYDVQDLPWKRSKEKPPELKFAPKAPAPN